MKNISRKTTRQLKAKTLNMFGLLPCVICSFMSYAIIKPVTVEIAVEVHKNILCHKTLTIKYSNSCTIFTVKPYPELTIPKTFKIRENIHKVDARYPELLSVNLVNHLIFRSTTIIDQN